MTDTSTGGCSCGRVRYRIERTTLFKPYACHCGDCQTRSGSAFAIQLPVIASDIRVAGETMERHYQVPSGANARIVGCAACLTRIYSATDQRPGLINLRAGTLDDSGSLVPGFHLWTSSKQSWVVIPDDVPAFDTQPGSLTEWQSLLLPDTKRL